MFVVPGVAEGAPANVFISAWDGNYNSFGDALTRAANGFSHGPFVMFLGSAAAPPASLMNMPQLDVRGYADVPEPQTFGLIIAGGIILALFRRRASRQSPLTLGV